MGQKVTFIVDAKHAEAIQAFLNVANAIDKAGGAGQAAGQKVTNAGKQAGEAWGVADKVLGRVNTTFLQLTAGTSGFYAALRLVSSQLERIGQLQLKAKEKMVGGMPGYQRMLLNTPENWLQDPASMNKFVTQGLQAMRQPTQDPFFEMAATGFGAHGGLDEATTKNAIQRVAELAGKKNMPAEDSHALLSVLIDTLNAQLQKGEKPNVDQTLGSLLSMQSVARSTSLHDLATFDARAILYHYIHGGAKDLGQAIGFQAAVARHMPDPKGRRAATGDINIWESLRTSYGDVWEKGFRAKDLPTVEDWDKLTPQEKLRRINAQDNFGLAMRARLKGSLNTGTKERNLAMAMHWGEGALHGEAGLRQMGENIISPNSYLAKEADEAAKEVQIGPAAGQFLDRQLTGKFLSEQQKLHDQIGAAQGARAAAEWANVNQAKRGVITEQVNELGDIVQRNFATQYLKSKFSSWEASGKEGPELDAMLIDVAQEAQRELRANALQRGQLGGFTSWARKKYGVEAQTVPTDTPFLKLFPPKIREEYLGLVMTEDEKRQIQALEKWIEAQRENTARSRNGAEVPGPAGAAVPAGSEAIPELPTAPGQPAGVPSSGSGATPGLRDQSLNDAIDQMKQLVAAVEQLAANDASRRLDIMVEDRAGRPLSRTTSRPSALERQYDEAVG